MAKIVIEVHTYIFFVDGNIIEQDVFDSDQAALHHAQLIESRRGEKVLVARFLEEGDHGREER